MRFRLALTAASLVASMSIATSFAQGTDSPKLGDEKYKPSVGQSGKDVIWVPTPDQLVDRMLKMAQVTPNDYVVDLGSGDGKIVIAGRSANDIALVRLLGDSDQSALPAYICAAVRPCRATHATPASAAVRPASR